VQETSAGLKAVLSEKNEELERLDEATPVRCDWRFSFLSNDFIAFRNASRSSPFSGTRRHNSPPAVYLASLPAHHRRAAFLHRSSYYHMYIIRTHFNHRTLLGSSLASG
jgi:hypothetical protein